MSDVEQSHPAIANIGPLTEAGRATWQAIAELVELVSDGSWAIVGGQMVAIHAALAGVDPPRVTDDGDVVVDVRTFGRRAMRRSPSRWLLPTSPRLRHLKASPVSFEGRRRSTCLLRRASVATRQRSLPVMPYKHRALPKLWAGRLLSPSIGAQVGPPSAARRSWVPLWRRPQDPERSSPLRRMNG